MLRDEAYERLKECLLKGKLSPGQPVAQMRLVRLIACPVGGTREAVHAL